MVVEELEDTEAVVETVVELVGDAGGVEDRSSSPACCEDTLEVRRLQWTLEDILEAMRSLRTPEGTWREVPDLHRR